MPATPSAGASAPDPAHPAVSGADPTARLSALERWGRFVQRRRGLVLTVTLLALVPTLGVLFSFPGEFQDASRPVASTDAGKGLALIDDQIEAASRPTFLLILGDPARDWQDPGFEADVRQALAAAQADERVVSVLVPFDVPPGEAAGMVSKDGHRILAVVTMEGEFLEAEAAYPDVRASVEHERLEVVATGALAIAHDFDTVFKEDLPRTEAVTIPLTLIVLVLVFGAVVAALLPVAIGVLAVMAGTGATMFLANFTVLPDWAVQLVAMIGLGVAIDYSLFIVNRFRQELAAGATREHALGRAMATSGHAVLFSGLTVAVSLGALVFFRGLDFASNGYAVAAVVGFAVLFAFTLLPALLAFLGPRINRWRLGRKQTLEQAAQTSGFWHGLAGFVMRRPVPALLLVLAIVGLLAFPVLGIRFGGWNIDSLHEGAESRQGFELLADEFPSQGETEHILVVRWSDGAPTTSDHIGELYDISRAAAAVPGVVNVAGPVDLDPTMTRADYQELWSSPAETWDPQAARVGSMAFGAEIAVLTIHASTEGGSDAAQDLVRDLQDIPDPAGAHIYVTGNEAYVVDTMDLIVDHLPVALAVMVLATFVLLAIQVRSIVLPLKAIVMNFLSVAASFGLVVWIFQEGHLTGLLDFTPIAMDAGMLLLMFCIVFGLSMDYEVLLLSRMHEEYLRTGDNTKAVQQGLERSGRIITGAALIMVLVFSAFGVVRITMMKVMGVGLAFAILFDATVIRAILVPALMRLMGKWNWWAPRFMAGPLPPSFQQGGPVGRMFHMSAGPVAGTMTVPPVALPAVPADADLVPTPHHSPDALATPVFPARYDLPPAPKLPPTHSSAERWSATHPVSARRAATQPPTPAAPARPARPASPAGPVRPARPADLDEIHRAIDGGLPLYGKDGKRLG